MATYFLLDPYEPYARIMAPRLRRHGHTLRAFFSPFELLAALKLERPDAILVDWYPYWCTGPELVRLLRGHVSFRRLPIALLAHGPDPQAQQTAHDVGACCVIDKSGGVSALLGRVLGLLGWSPTPADGARPHPYVSGVEYLAGLEALLNRGVLRGLQLGSDLPEVG